MEAKMKRLRKKYKAFQKGHGDVLALRDEAKQLLEEVRITENTKFVEELEDMLIDLEFSIEEVI